MYERTWILKKLKQYTFLLILLGLLFSTITYLDRISSELGPTESDQQALFWIKENVGDVVVFSDPDNSYVIRYLANKQAVDYPHQRLDLQKQGSDEIYIRQFFPFLEENKVRILFISEQMQEEELGFIFLLRNERFKLVHSSGNAEVWSFN